MCCDVLQAPRELMLALTRTGDSVGIVAVDYSVVYVPPEGEQSQGTTLTFTGSVQLQGGQTSRDFSLTLPDSTFLETGGNFMAVIDNATLVGGGKSLALIYCSSLPGPS